MRDAGGMASASRTALRFDNRPRMADIKVMRIPVAINLDRQGFSQPG